MSPVDFDASVLAWHDFYLAVAGASAALLGLLFVGVSINLAEMAAAERPGLRASASQAFANLVNALALGLLMLVPNFDAPTMAAFFAAIAALSLVRSLQHLVPVARAGSRPERLRLLRRIGWPIAASLILGYVATVLWRTADARALSLLVGVVLVLMIGAAQSSWDILVTASRQPGD
ncbi:MAG TPA: hypothetical protein VGK63_03150, partial [Candidatus Limnocylindrales bacterium]